MKGHTLPGINQSKSSAFQQNGDKWVLDADGNKLYHKGSMRDKDAKVIAKSVDSTKHGGKGTTSDAEQEALETALIRERNQEIHNMNKKQLLDASGKKTNLVNKIFSSKKNLKNKLKYENVKNRQRGTGKQVMSQKTKEGLGGDEYTKVIEKS